MTAHADGIVPGKDLGTRELVISRDWIEKYHGSIDDRNPWYTEASPLGGPVAPCAVFNYEMQLFGGWHPPGVKGVLNTSQRWRFFQPMRPGQRVIVKARVAERYVKRGRDHITMEATACDEAGLALCQVEATDSWPVPQGQGASEAGRTSQPAPASPDTHKGPRQTSAAHLPLGGEPPPFSRLVTREMCQINGGPLVNFHTDLEAARRLGLPDLMAAGPMFVCFYSEMFTKRFGLDWMRGGTLDFKLLKPVLAGETVTARAVVKGKEPAGALVRVLMDVWCERLEDGAKTSAGAATALVAP